MAGRIIPVALATLLGVSIGVATFDGELKKQKRIRLQEEYDREVAAIAAANNTAPPAIATAASSTPPLQTPANNQNEPIASTSSSWSSMLGLWAWKKEEEPIAGTSPNTTTIEKINAQEAGRKP